MPSTITTDDKHEIEVGEQAFNYYDHVVVTLDRIDDQPEIDGTYWATWITAAGGYSTLDGSRVCSLSFARSQGWIAR